MVFAPELLTSAHLVGTPIVAAEREFYRTIWQDPDVVRTLGGPRPLAVIDAKVDRLCDRWRSLGYGVYTLREPGGAPCGYAGLAPTDAGGRDSVEILYGFLPAVWGRGLATEVAHALVDVAFGPLGLPEVCAFTWTENRGSQRVIEKAGLVYQFDFEQVGLPHRYYLRRAPG